MKTVVIAAKSGKDFYRRLKCRYNGNTLSLSNKTMAFTAYTVAGADVNGLTHVNAIQVLLSQLAGQVSEFGVNPDVQAQIETMAGTTVIADTAAEFSAANPTPIIQSLTENQLTGSLTVALALPVKNTATATGILTQSRIAFGEDV